MTWWTAVKTAWRVYCLLRAIAPEIEKIVETIKKELEKSK